MTITRPGNSIRIGAIGLLLLLIALPGESRADSECPGKGSTGCWASACVFTPEAFFINGVGKDGYRRAEYVIPEKGRIQYRTVKYFDAECTRADETEVSEWLEDSTDFRKLESTAVDDTLIVEQVAFGPFAHGSQRSMVVRGRFYVLEKNLLCTSSNLLYAEDGPAIDLRPSSDPKGAVMRKACLHRLTGLLTPTSANIVGTVVPPYPQGFDSFEGICIAGMEDPVNACKYTIGILQTSRDDKGVGIFAGVYDRFEQDRTRWKVTDSIAYPNVPDGHIFTQVGCQLNGAEDETVIAVVDSSRDSGMDPAGLGRAVWARKLNVATGKLVEIKPSSVQCLAEAMAEGHYGGSVDHTGDGRE